MIRIRKEIHPLDCVGECSTARGGSSSSDLFFFRDLPEMLRQKGMLPRWVASISPFYRYSSFFQY